MFYDKQAWQRLVLISGLRLRRARPSGQARALKDWSIQFAGRLSNTVQNVWMSCFTLRYLVRLTSLVLIRWSHGLASVKPIKDAKTSQTMEFKTGDIFKISQTNLYLLRLDSPNPVIKDASLDCSTIVRSVNAREPMRYWYETASQPLDRENKLLNAAIFYFWSNYTISLVGLAGEGKTSGLPKWATDKVTRPFQDRVLSILARDLSRVLKSIIWALWYSYFLFFKARAQSPTYRIQLSTQSCADSSRVI
jgi:hypothetical protein